MWATRLVMRPTSIRFCSTNREHRASSVYVGNLAGKTTKKDLAQLFSTHGKIRSVRLPRGKAFGFVDFNTEEEATSAIADLNGREVEGRVLRVSTARRTTHVVPSVISRWTTTQVRDWATKEVGIKAMHAQKLVENEITGALLLNQNKLDFERCGMPVGPAYVLDRALAEVKATDDPKYKLWSALLAGDYTESDGIVCLPDGLQWLTEPDSLLFVRESHVGLFNMVKKLSAPQQPRRGVIITGNPGIGKSWFLSYCLYLLAKEKKTVFFESAAKQQCWLFRPNGKVTPYDLALEPYPRKELEDPSTFYLFDPYGGAPREPLEFNAFTIIAASPNNKHYKEFYKKEGVEKFYMPCWTWDEIHEKLVQIKKVYSERKTAIPPLFENEVRLRERYDKFGGIWRYIFYNPNKTKWDEELEKVLAMSTVSALRQTIGGPDMLPSVSHKIFQYDVTPEYKQGRVRFASNYIAERVVEHIWKQEKTTVLEFLKYTEGAWVLSSVRGRLFEPFVHVVLQAGGRFKARPLSGGDETILELPKLEEIKFEGMKLSQDIAKMENKYIRPISGFFPAFDSFARLSRTVAFQVTGDLDHGLVYSGVLQVLSIVPSDSLPLRVYWCVPPNQYPDFRAQSVIDRRQEKKRASAEELEAAKNKLEQWVLKIEWQ